MQGNKDIEVQYIVESINKQKKIETITPDYKLNIKNKGRLIEPKKYERKQGKDCGFITPRQLKSTQMDVQSRNCIDRRRKLNKYTF
jgi:hypothetical protein